MADDERTTRSESTQQGWRKGRAAATTNALGWYKQTIVRPIDRTDTAREALLLLRMVTGDHRHDVARYVRLEVKPGSKVFPQF